MPKAETLARIQQDLSEGRLGSARDRLHGLITADPTDFSLRLALADVYSRLGYPAEAGRWRFLQRPVTPEQAQERESFLRQCQGKPELILHRLRLPCPPEATPDPTVFQGISSEPPFRSQKVKNRRTRIKSDRWTTSVLILGCASFICLAFIGLVTVIRWLLP